MSISDVVVEGGASGTELRHYATEGMNKELNYALSNIANPASVDEFGKLKKLCICCFDFK